MNNKLSDKELESARATIEENEDRPQVKYSVRLMRRAKKDLFSCEDVLCRVNFEESSLSKSKTPLLSVLSVLFDIVVRVIDKLKSHFDDDKRYLVYTSFHSPNMTSDVFAGSQLQGVKVNSSQRFFFFGFCRRLSITRS